MRLQAAPVATLEAALEAADDPPSPLDAAESLFAAFSPVAPLEVS